MSCMWERRGAYRVLVGKPEGRRPLDRSGSGQGQVGAVVNAVINHRLSYNAGNFVTLWEPVSFFSGRPLFHGVS